MQDLITFERFGPEHLDGALALSQAERWPHRREDWALLSSLSRGVVALAGGEVAGTALATPFGPVAMANMIIVGRRMRGRGLGRHLMDRVMAEAAPAEWRLIATAEGQPLYEKLGFVATGRIAQHQGILTAAPDAPALRPADRAVAGALDRAAATGADRAPLLDALWDVAELVAAPGGYAARRTFGRGELIGPVIAPEAETAKALIAALMAGREERFLRLDVPEESGLSPWLESLGLPRVGGGTCMSRGTPAPRGGTTFALAAQALG